MKKSILILGSGKMARNIGSYFLKRHYTVSWVSENRETLAQLEHAITREVRRFNKINPEFQDQYSCAFFTSKECAQISSANIILECTTENLDKKQRALQSVKQLASDSNTLLLSTSSSLLPEEIHPLCIGCHFFYPVEMSECVELIFPKTVPESKKRMVKKWLEESNLSYIEQTAENAFAVNRLLLPLQTEAVRLLQAGYDPHVLDQASSSDLLPAGQLSFMDSVGLNVIGAGVNNYLKRMPETLQADYDPLITGIDKLLSMGKRGKSNKDGLLFGQPLPWPIKPCSTDVSCNFLYLFIYTCYTFIETNQISFASLEKVLSSIFLSEISFADKAKQISEPTLLSFIDNLYCQTQLSYYKNLQ